MAVSTVSSTVPYLEPSAMQTTGKSELSRDDFMKLFITQLQYQDPMKPMDSYEMASQMAQFSTMDATMKMAESIESLLAYQKSQNNLQLLGLIGKSVQVAGNEFAVKEGVAAPAEFSLANAADLCMVNIYDASGRMVRTLNLGRADYGAHDVAWDGKDFNGNTVADGKYRYEVDAVDGAGQQIEVDYRTTGTVTGLNFDSGVAQVVVDDRITMEVGSITEVR
ncbi:MAG: flagellar hook capping FlgD N-terminal domain-containing protein [Thermodesulfobacteriota bacterium]